MFLLLKKNIFLIFWVIALLGIIVISLDLTLLDYIFKPLLIPVLLVALVLRQGRTKGSKKIFIALIFSFLGDVLLLFEKQDSIFFILGLACFLITHIFYIAYFWQIKQAGPSPIKDHPYIIVLILLYVATLFYLLWPNLKELKIAVTIYGVIISIMLYLSLCIPYKIGKIVSRLFVIGAISFVVSDSLLALNKFYKPFPFAAILIRISYCYAQYMLVKAFIKKRY